MSVSVAMATYNGERYILEQLLSIACQKKLPDELIICDDNSSDDTCVILEGFASGRSLPRVKLFKNEATLGFPHNFGRALELCSGEIVFLCDQDDMWFEDKIMQICGIMEQDPDAFYVMHNAYICDEELRHRGDEIFGNGLHVVGACTAIRRELLDIALPLPPEARSHDGWLHDLADGLGVRQVSTVPLQLWRRHDRAVSTWVTCANGNTVPHRGKTWKRMRYLRNMTYSRHVSLVMADLEDVELLQARLKEWLEAKQDGHVLYGRACRFCTILPQRRETLRARLALLETSRPRRAARSVLMLLERRYRGFYRCRDALMDLRVKAR